MRYLLVLLGLMVVNVAQAIDCRENPDCALMGYSTQTDPNCLDDGYISCPFDTAYKKCVNYKCEAWGFTTSDKSSWCAEVATCPTDKNFTLCQKPCFATNYASLKDLAESGKCKVVTVRNDITIPENQGITLHADTIIDGGNHTITSSGNIKSLIVFSMNNNTGMKNLKLRHTQTQTQEGFNLLKASDTNHISLKDIDILASFDADTYWAAVIDHGAYNISGQFMLEINLKQTGGHVAGFWSATCGFTDAQASIKGSRDSVNIFDIFDIVKVILAESTFHADTSGFLFVRSSSMTLKNSEAGFKGGILFSAPQTDSKLDLILEEKASLALELATETGKDKTTIKTTDNTSELILNGKTYKPVKVGTTKLSEIENSADWKEGQ